MTRLRPWALLLAGTLAVYGGAALGGLGFYHDDWWFLSVMHFGEPGFLGRIRTLFADGAGVLHLRPLDAPLLSALYGAAGLNPLGWQLFSLAVQAACAAGTYGLLRAWGIGVRTAVFGALFALAYPNKDGAVYWPMVVIVPVSYALFLAGYLLHLRWVGEGRRGALAAVPIAVVASLALYDQSLLQFAAWAIVPAASAPEARGRLRVGLAVAWGAAAAFLLYKFVLVPRLFGVAFNKPLLLSFKNASVVTLRAMESTVGYRILLSVIAGCVEGFTRNPVSSLFAAALPWVALKTLPEEAKTAPADLRRLAWLGGAFFVLGYLPFLVSDYRPTPLTHMNRLNFIPSAALGLLAAAAMARRPGKGGLALASLLSLFLCAHVGFASYWVRAAEQVGRARDIALRDIARWPAEATLIFRWTDPMVGGHAPALIASWDSTGAVRLWTGDRTRQADVVLGGFKFFPGGLSVSNRLIPLDRMRLLDMSRGAILIVQAGP